MKSTDPIGVLRAFVAKHASQREAARALRISQPYLHDILHGKRSVSDNMLAKLGLTRVEVVTRLQKAS